MSTGRPNSIYRQGRPKTSTGSYSGRRNVVSPLHNRPGIKSANPLRPQTALGKGPRTHLVPNSPWGNPTESRSGSATFMAPVSMMKVAAPTDLSFANSEPDADADAEVMNILTSHSDEPEVRDDPIPSRIGATYHMFRSHQEYPVDEEGEREIQMGVDGAWKTVVFPSLYPNSREEVLLLESTSQKMMEDSMANLDNNKASAIDRSLESVKVLHTCIHELGRHVATESPERARLLFKLLESAEFECAELSRAAEKAAHAAAREAIAQHEKENASKLEQQQEELSRLHDKYDTSELNVQHLLTQLDKWEEMQKMFREEIDQKHAEHIAFRREQEAWRKERKDLDMEIQVLHKEAELLNNEARAANEAKEATTQQLQESQHRNQLVSRDFEGRLAEAYKASDDWRNRAAELQAELDELSANQTAFGLEQPEDHDTQEGAPEEGAAAEGALKSLNEEECLSEKPDNKGPGGRFAGFLSEPKKKKKKKKGAAEHEIRSLEWLEQCIEDIYERKIVDDLIDDECGQQHARMPEYVYEYLLEACGTKAAADNEGRELLKALDCWQKENDNVTLFGEFFLEKLGLDVLNFYLSLKAQMRTSPYGVNYPPRNGEKFIDYFRTLMVSRTVLAPLLDMKAIMTFNSKVEKLAVRASDADVAETLSRAPTGQEKKVSCIKYERMCLQVLQKQRKTRSTAIKKALFPKKTVDHKEFFKRIQKLDPMLHKRFVNRIYMEAAAISPASGVNFAAFLKISDKTGLLNEKFNDKVAEAQRREEPSCATATRSMIEQTWGRLSEVSQWVIGKLQASPEWNQVASATALRSLCSGMEADLPRGTEIPAYKLAQTLQGILITTALVVSRHTVYPSELEEVPVFQEDVDTILKCIQRWARMPGDVFSSEPKRASTAFTPF